MPNGKEKPISESDGGRGVTATGFTTGPVFRSIDKYDYILPSSMNYAGEGTIINLGGSPLPLWHVFPDFAQGS